MEEWRMEVPFTELRMDSFANSRLTNDPAAIISLPKDRFGLIKDNLMRILADLSVLQRKFTTTQCKLKSFSMMRIGYRVLCCLSLVPLLSAEASAARQSPLSAPFAVRNQNPFIVVHGLPATSSAKLLPMGESSLRLQYDITNHSKRSGTAEESIVLDGETYRATLTYQRGIADGWQLGLELPLIAHSSGVMDNFIESWHDIFGLTNRDRDPWPKNYLHFKYIRDGVTEAEMSGSATGSGDMRLLLSRRLPTSGKENHLALNASLKFPTGDAKRFLGSGSFDLALWLNAAATVMPESRHIGGYLHAGVLLLGKGDLLPDRQRSSLMFGGAGLHWHAWEQLMLKAQLDMHGDFYDSGLDQLGRSSVLLTVGGSLQLRRGVVDLAIGENLTTDTVPDFGINLAYRIDF
jgi:hypothetical protein